MVHIQVGRESELEPFLDLLESAATWLWDRGIEQWAPGSMRAQAPLLGECARSGWLVIARSESELVGGCTLVPHSSPEWSGRDEPALYVHKLVVATSHSGQGIARDLLAWCEQRARAMGVQRLRLDCWDGNSKLRALYCEHGYRELDAACVNGYWARRFERELV